MFFQKFWRRHKKRVFVAILFLVPFAPFIFRKVELPRLHINDIINSYIVHPVAELLSDSRSGIHYIWENYFALVGAKKENATLKEEISELNKAILELSEIKAESERLRGLINIPILSEIEGIGAKIIGQDSQAEALSYFINVGANQGIKVRMPVLTPEGVVGSIRRVYANSSIFVSALDPTHVLDGIVKRSRARMIVEGLGAPLLAQLKYLDRAQDIRVGDEILTSGLDASFPKGLLVGYVVELSRPRHGVLQEAKLRAAVDPGKLEEVMVLKYQNPITEILEPQ